MGSFVAMCLAAVSAVTGGELHLEFRTRAGDRELAVGDSWDGGGNGELSLSRLDFLLSGLALQRDDGSWVESAADWAEFVSIGKDRRSVRCDGVAAGNYQRVRFRIGLDPRTDLLDPASFAPGHPLHPDVNGLHWSWQGGFIYMALEGRTSRAVKGGDGFSFHLARAGNAPTVELPVSFRGDAPATLRIDIDVPAILRDIEFARDGNSTHSRDGDPIPKRIARNLAGALRIASVGSGPLVSSSGFLPERSAIPPGTRPYDLLLPRRFPAVDLPADNPLTVEGVDLGRRLFHESRISVNDSVSCASCHQQETGFAGVRKFSIGAEGHAGRRRSMPLANLAWQKDFFWDGRAPSLREQVLMPIADPHEMNETPENVVAKLGGDPIYQETFTRAFGSPGVTVERLSLALEQFLLTKVSHQARFDLALEGAAEFTETEKRGLQLFVTEHAPERGLRGADCFHCHGGMLFTDNRFHDNGLALDPADPGRMEVTGDETDRGKFKTPSLRNVALRPPYMHDGRFATLEEVVEHYNSGVLRRPNLDPNLAKHPADGLGLSDLEKKELIAFLRTLTDESFTSSQPDSPQP